MSRQVCQYILDEHIQSGQGGHCNIVVTQPRRISAVSVADRICQERNQEAGKAVGYSVRFDSVLPRPYGSVLFCTVGNGPQPAALAGRRRLSPTVLWNVRNSGLCCALNLFYAVLGP